MSARARVATCLCAVALGSACAGSPGGHNVRQSFSTSSNAFAHLVVSVEGGRAGAADRVRGKIVAEIQEEAPDRFESINAPGPPEGALWALVRITRHDPGSAVARAIAPGLGGIQIDGDLFLREGRDGPILGSYRVTKDFFWGGFYGSATSIEQVEIGFAREAASLILEPR